MYLKNYMINSRYFCFNSILIIKSNYKIIINPFMTKWNYPNYIEKDGIYIMYSMFLK